MPKVLKAFAKSLLFLTWKEEVLAPPPSTYLVPALGIRCFILFRVCLGNRNEPKYLTVKANDVTSQTSAALPCSAHNT